MKKVLIIAAKANMIQQFNHRNIKLLMNLGYEVHVATNMIDFGSMSESENEKMIKWLRENGVQAHQIDFERRMGTLFGNLKAIKQLKILFQSNDFMFIHVHSPLGSILGRLVAAFYRVPSIYTAHGFHFFKKGPIRNWILFYPLEWIFSFITDTLITINDEDYTLSKKHFHAKKIIKINGIGIDVTNAKNVPLDVKQKARKKLENELGLSKDNILISSIGELSKRKNHIVVLDAIQKLPIEKQKNIYYVIAGTGNNGDLLEKKASGFSFQNNFKLLGYRNDIHDINYASDISIFPSFQEGLGVAGLDATIDGTFLIGANRRGIKDYIINGENGVTFAPENSDELARLIDKITDNPAKLHENNFFEFLNEYDSKKVDEIMKEIYLEMKS